MNVSKRKLLFSLATLLAIGLQPVARTEAAPARSRNTVHVSGGGQYLGQFGLTTVTCHANVQPDGSVVGQFEQHNPASGSIIHGSINRITFLADNIAIIGGTLINVKQRPEDMWWIAEGNDVALFIVDHRQGKATPDMISPYRVTAAINRDSQPVGIGWDGFVNEVQAWLSGADGARDPGEQPLQNGNFQIRQP